MTATVPAARQGRQLCVFLDDRPGTLGRVCERLGAASINIQALSLAEGSGHGYVRMVVDQPDAAVARLKEDGDLFFEKDVLVLELENRPGALGAAAALLGAAGVNIEYAYCAAGSGVRSGMVVLRVDDLAKALKALA